MTIDDVSYKCSVSHNLEKQLGDPRRNDMSQHFFDPFAQNSSPYHESRRPHNGGNFNNFNDNLHHQQTWNNRMGHNGASSFISNQRIGMDINRRDDNLQRRFSPEAHAPTFPQRSQVFDSIDKSLVMRYRQKFVDEPLNMSSPSMGMQGTFNQVGFDDFHLNRPFTSSFMGVGESKNDNPNQFFALPSSKTFFEDFKLPIDNSERDSMGSNDSSNSAQSFQGNNKAMGSDGLNAGFDLHRFLPDLSGSSEFREPAFSEFF